MHCGKPAAPKLSWDNDPFKRWWVRGTHIGCFFKIVYKDAILKELKENWKFWEDIKNVQKNKREANKDNDESLRQISIRFDHERRNT